MDIPEPFRDLDAEQLSREAWGAQVDIAEILRSTTLRSIDYIVSAVQVDELRHRADEPEGNVDENLQVGFRDKGWSDAPMNLSCNMIQNLLRDLPVDEFLDKNTHNFLRRYGVGDELERVDDFVIHDDCADFDFWYGLLTEGREIGADIDGTLRLQARVMEVLQFTPDELHGDKEARASVGGATHERLTMVTEHAIMSILSQRIEYRTLLDRDRMLDTVFDVISNASVRLKELIRQEWDQKL